MSFGLHFLEKFRMCADTDNINDICVIVNPHEEEVVLNVAFPASGVLTDKAVAEITCRKRNVIEEILQDFIQRLHLTGIVPVTLKIFLCGGRVMELPHQSIALTDFMNASKLLALSSPAYLPERTSLIAATVSGLGRRSRDSVRRTSTRLLRLRFSRLASMRRRSIRAVLRRKAVCFLSVATLITVSLIGLC